MPSKDFMERVLGTGRNDEEIVDEVEEEELHAESPDVPDDPEPEVEEEAPEEESAEGEEDQEDDAVEAEEQPEEEQEAEDTAQEEEEFYLGRYKTREEAEAGWLEKEGMISRQGTELAELRQQQAEILAQIQQQQGYMTALAQQQQAGGDFEEWAESFFEAGNAVGGADEALQASVQSGDPSYFDAYLSMWGERDAFGASRYASNVDAIVLQQQQQMQQASQPPPLQDMINHTWMEVAQSDPDMKDVEFATGVGKILTNTPALRAAALSGDPEMMRSAISVARDGYRMAVRTGNGTPRKVKSSDAERLREDKLAATVTTGDSAPDRGRGSTPEVPAELQDMMSAIQRGEGGFPKLRQ